VWTALYTYLQLQENVAGPYNYTGGWDFYKRVLSRFQQLSGTDAVSTDDKKLQTWVGLASDFGMGGCCRCSCISCDCRVQTSGFAFS
jgi:hypothetical protein